MWLSSLYPFEFQIQSLIQVIVNFVITYGKVLKTRMEPRLKHPQISISGPIASKSQTSLPGHFSQILCCQPLTSKPKTWQMLICSLQSSIYLGICLQSTSALHNFTSLSYLHHGHCLLSQAGKVCDHRRSELSDLRGGFKFWEGDILKFEYKMESLVVRKGDREIWRFELERPQEGDCYRVCACLLMEGDSVRIGSQ